jgi:Mg-chelatase subunit ChlD
MGRILFEGLEAPEGRVRKLARLLRAWVPRDPPPLPASRFVFTGDELQSAADRRGPSDLDVLAFAERAGLTDTDLEGVFGARELADLRARAQRLRLYAQAVPVARKCLQRRARLAFAGYRGWSPGQSVRELDVVATLQRGHTFLPGVNTLRRRLDRRGTSLERGAGAVVLLVDDSGSTEGCVLEREKEAAFSVVATARLLGDEVACVAFGTTVTVTLPLTTRYQRVEEALCGLSSSSGGTRLAPALEEGLRLARQCDRFTVLLMTDAEIGDLHEVEALVRGMPRLSQLVAFCFAGQSSSPASLRAALAPPHRVLEANPGLPFAEIALKELYA